MDRFCSVIRQFVRHFSSRNWQIMGDTYDAYQPTSSMLSKLLVIRGTAVEMIVLSTATQKVAKQSTMEIKITLGSFRYRDVSSDS